MKKHKRMNMRWYAETLEGEIIDGPFKSKQEADIASALHMKLYKYQPIVVPRELNMQPEKRNESNG
jgi:hypothetical protein